MGLVWLAEDVKLKRFVALEFLSAELAADAQGRADEAIAWLERGIEEHDTLVGFLHIYTPWFAPALDRDTRYAAILERLGLARVPAAPSGV